MLVLCTHAGLSVIHRARLIHLDVKPSNVMIVHEPTSDDGTDYALRGVLIDVGVALPATGSVIINQGSMPYWVPEVTCVVCCLLLFVGMY